MSDGHFRSPQPCNGQYPLQKSASKKVLILKKSRAKIPLVMGGSQQDRLLSTFDIGRSRPYSPLGRSDWWSSLIRNPHCQCDIGHD